MEQPEKDTASNGEMGVDGGSPPPTEAENTASVGELRRRDVVAPLAALAVSAYLVVDNKFTNGLGVPFGDFAERFWAFIYQQ